MSKSNAFVTHTLDRTRSLEGMPLASFRRRAIAWLIDFALVTAVAGGWGLLVGSQASFQPFDSFGDLLFVLAYFGLGTYLGKGQTLGKRWLRIRVISIVAEKMTVWQCVERSLGYAASMLEAGFGFWQYFIHHNRQTVHDRIAETIVVDARAQAADIEAAPSA